MQLDYETVEAALTNGVGPAANSGEAGLTANLITNVEELLSFEDEVAGELDVKSQQSASKGHGLDETNGGADGG